MDRQTDDHHAHQPVACRVEDLLQYRPKDDATEAELEEGLAFIAELGKYLSSFAAPVKSGEDVLCFHCGTPLYGSLLTQLTSPGGFRWGLVHGEGNCAKCGWPARAHHYPKREDRSDLIQLRDFPLQYMPEFVVRDDFLDEGDDEV